MVRNNKNMYDLYYSYIQSPRKIHDLIEICMNCITHKLKVQGKYIL